MNFTTTLSLRPTVLAEAMSDHSAVQAFIGSNLSRDPGNVRLMTAKGRSLQGLIDEGSAVFVEPCDAFDLDGVYVLGCGDHLTVMRKVRLLMTGGVAIETTDNQPGETCSLADFQSTVTVLGRVIASCALRMH